MCGIAGIYNFKKKRPVTTDQLKAMADTLVHRGPDDEGYFASGNVGLAHRRLSIIDLEGGHQPMANSGKTVWVAFNGEIYNFKELKKKLAGKGHTFRTRSDTEAIIHLYEEYGVDCFTHLRGMFAIALWDATARKLLLARDRVGKKPLFYYCKGENIIFASEMKAILEMDGIDRTIDLQALSDYFSLLYIPAPKSIFSHIRKVLPGHYLEVTEERVRETEYWDLSFAQQDDLDENEWCEKIMETYRDAVSSRLISDVPLGAFLSGGVDSSSVVGLMNDLTSGPVITSSIGFEDKEFDESIYARQVAAIFKTDHHEKIVRPDAMEVLEKLTWHYDEPFADSSAIPTYYVSRVAREHVTVALSGDGGDENFCGYRRYYFDKKENDLRGVLPLSIRALVFGTLAALYPKADWAPRVLRAKATFESLACSHIEGYFRSMSAFQPQLKEMLLHPDVLYELAGYDSMDIFKHYYDKADIDDPVSRIQYLDIKTYLADDILVKVDRASMANSLEVRSPILDHEFMELASRIPSSFKLRGRNGKYIFKKSLEGILGPEILYRQKMGFAIPLARWFRGELKDAARDAIFDQGCDGMLNLSTVEGIWKEHQSGLRNRATELWTILMFRMWQRLFESSGG